MTMLQKGIDGARAFLGDVLAEARKATWPSRQELVESTVVVIVCLVLISLFVGLCDRVLVAVLRVLVPSG